MKTLIIGGGTAGTETAWRLRQKNKEIEIVILEKGEHTQYSPCALPYLLGGKIKNPQDIFLFPGDFYAFNNIELKLESEVLAIEREKKQVRYRQGDEEKMESYDKLVIAVGAKAKIPSIDGLEERGFFSLKSVDDVARIKKSISSGDKALVVGSGYIGIELSDALLENGLEVTLVEAQDRILPAGFDSQVSEKIKQYIEDKGVKIITGAEISRVDDKQAQVNGADIDCDHVFVSCGLTPDIRVAEMAGLECEEGVLVDRAMRTSDPNIYACGDSVQSLSSFDEKKIFSQLATTAVRQARVIAGSIAGEEVEQDPVTSANVSRFGDMIFGSCGVSQDCCEQNGIKTISAFYSSQSRAKYYPDAQEVYVKIIALDDGRIVGCQLAGFEEIAGRINLMSLAIKKEMTLSEFIGIETCYNPAVAPIFDPLVLTAEICLKKLKAKNE